MAKTTHRQTEKPCRHRNKTNIEQAIMLLQAARSCIDAYTAERAAKQLHIGTLSQMNKDIGMITKKLSGYVEG